jgi:hypothetical protein
VAKNELRNSLLLRGGSPDGQGHFHVRATRACQTCWEKLETHAQSFTESMRMGRPYAHDQDLRKVS